LPDILLRLWYYIFLDLVIILDYGKVN
jgi:hypothetical protein